MPKSIKPKDRPELASRIKDLRERAGLTQGQFGELCGGVHQAVVARWEQGKFEPPGRAIAAMARLAGEPERWWWLERVGLQKDDMTINQLDSQYIPIPLLKESVAAGSGRALNEAEIDKYLSFPREWIPRSSKVTALRVKGDSMWPIIDDGYIVLVDTSERDPKRLIGEMVAAREGDGVTIKWLRKEGRFFHLVPQHTSVRHPVRILTPDEDFGVIGRVLKWIGEPPKK